MDLLLAACWADAYHKIYQVVVARCPGEDHRRIMRAWRRLDREQLVAIAYRAYELE